MLWFLRLNPNNTNPTSYKTIACVSRLLMCVSSAILSHSLSNMPYFQAYLWLMAHGPCYSMLTLSHANHTHVHSHVWIKSKSRQPTYICSMPTPSVITPMVYTTHHDLNVHGCVWQGSLPSLDHVGSSLMCPWLSVAFAIFCSCMLTMWVMRYSCHLLPIHVNNVSYVPLVSVSNMCISLSHPKVILKSSFTLVLYLVIVISNS